jgi:hypothetical protein
LCHGKNDEKPICFLFLFFPCESLGNVFVQEQMRQPPSSIISLQKKKAIRGQSSPLRSWCCSCASVKGSKVNRGIMWPEFVQIIAEMIHVSE